VTGGALSHWITRIREKSAEKVYWNVLLGIAAAASEHESGTSLFRRR
jgi:hypothetical protein